MSDRREEPHFSITDALPARERKSVTWLKNYYSELQTTRKDPAEKQLYADIVADLTILERKKVKTVLWMNPATDRHGDIFELSFKDMIHGLAQGSVGEYEYLPNDYKNMRTEFSPGAKRRARSRFKTPEATATAAPAEPALVTIPAAPGTPRATPDDIFAHWQKIFEEEQDKRTIPSGFGMTGVARENDRVVVRYEDGGTLSEYQHGDTRRISLGGNNYYAAKQMIDHAVEQYGQKDYVEIVGGSEQQRRLLWVACMLREPPVPMKVRADWDSRASAVYDGSRDAEAMRILQEKYEESVAAKDSAAPAPKSPAAPSGTFSAKLTPAPAS